VSAFASTGHAAPTGLGSNEPIAEPDDLAEEIIENLEAGLNSFRQVLSALNQVSKVDAQDEFGFTSCHEGRAEAPPCESRRLLTKYR
jgi:hypothetical protein